MQVIEISGDTDMTCTCETPSGFILDARMSKAKSVQQGQSSQMQQTLLQWVQPVFILDATMSKAKSCQDWFFTDLIFRGVRGSGHGLVVRPKGYVA